MKTLPIVLIIVSLLFVNCGLTIVESHDDNTHHEDPVVEIDTYLDIPYSIGRIIEPYTYGYFTPSLSRYSDYLDQANGPYDPYNLPCYVRSDFNGDGIIDYIYLFSSYREARVVWHLKTKMIAVLSSPGGRTVTEVELGTFSGPYSQPVEEFWGISLMEAGYYEFSTWINGIEYIEEVYLENDGIYLSSLDADEETIFFAEGDDLYEMAWRGKTFTRKGSIDTTKRTFENSKSLDKKRIESTKKKITIKRIEK